MLGILVLNIGGFAGPTGAMLSPHVPAPGTFVDEIAFAASMVLFEGKMRALFTMLFGASILLFIERSEAAGRDGDILQFRRLGWLALFGLLHFFLLWWGDILFSFALVGIVALFMRDFSVKAMVAAALVIFAGWHLGCAAMSLPAVAAEERVRLGTATPSERAADADYRTLVDETSASEMAVYRSGFVEQTANKLEERAVWPIETTLSNLGETLPLMLIGMALYRTGFFNGDWARRRMRQLAVAGTASGLALTLAIVAWLWQRGFPPQAMSAALLYWLAVPHLLMALGYASLLTLATPWLARTRLGLRLTAAGRMAFSNYVGTTILMTAIFYGWGLGLVGSLGRFAQFGVVALAWALMLAWSRPWLAHYRQGPLEWLWRSLTEKRWLPFRRIDIATQSH